MTDFACLDIETDWTRRITVIGAHRRGRGCRQWIAPDLCARELDEFLDGAARLFTFNGARFDLPVIRDQLGLDLAAGREHLDLLQECRRRGFRGGLKKVEKIFGIWRDTEGLDGRHAVGLWDRFRREGGPEALEVLLRYNREDAENLDALAVRLGLAPPAGPAGATVYGARPEIMTDGGMI